MIEQPRRPIFDRRLDVFGYEVGLHTRAEIDTLAGGHLCFVRITKDFLKRGLARKFPADHVALQIDREAAVRPGLWRELIALYEAGYVIAIDDFLVRPDSLPLLEITSMVKFDMRRLTPDNLRVQSAALSGYPVKTIVTGVDDYAVFEDCMRAEVDLFQGRFFETAGHIARNSAGSRHLARLRLIAAIQNQGIEFEQLDDLISTDMGISYRLLRLINSAYFSLPQPVGSVHHALVMLGMEQVRMWTVLIALAEFDDRPSELIRSALTRAKMCELLARATAAAAPEAHFTAGLFSLVEAFANIRMPDLLGELCLAADVDAALLHRLGGLGQVLTEVEAFHAGRLGPLTVNREVLRDTYMQAVSWADETFTTAHSLRRE
jgi:c-di-GMP-related signal transduction protein